MNTVEIELLHGTGTCRVYTQGLVADDNMFYGIIKSEMFDDFTIRLQKVDGVWVGDNRELATLGSINSELELISWKAFVGKVRVKLVEIGIDEDELVHITPSDDIYPLDTLHQIAIHAQ